MPNPTQPFLVLVTVSGSSGQVEPEAEVTFKSASDTSNVQIADSNGRLVYDIANIGYTSGETITVISKDKFNNEISTDTFIASGFMYTTNISLGLRDVGQSTTGYTTKSMLHNVGGEVVTDLNPSPVYQGKPKGWADATKDITWDSNNNPETITVTVDSGTYRKTITWDSNNNPTQVTGWVKQ